MLNLSPNGEIGAYTRVGRGGGGGGGFALGPVHRRVKSEQTKKGLVISQYTQHTPIQTSFQYVYFHKSPYALHTLPRSVASRLC